MSFITKPDFSNNRQVKQFQLSSTQLSGTTVFGVDDVLIPINITGDTINIDALQNIRTRGIILPNSLSPFTGITYQLLGRDTATGKVVEVTGISGGTSGGTGSFADDYTTGGTFDGSTGDLEFTRLSGGTYNVIIGQQTPFIRIDEGNGDGIIISGRTAANYGNVGFNALDFSTSYGVSSTVGATGSQSVLINSEDSIASGYGAFGGTGYLMNLTGTYSVGFGYDITNAGYSSLAIGSFVSTAGSTGFNFIGGNGGVNNGNACFVWGPAVTKGSGVGASVLGAANVDITSGNDGTDITAPMLIVGNGTHTTPVGAAWTASVRSNALVVLRNGDITAPSTTISGITSEVTGKHLITKEWIESLYTLSNEQKNITDNYTILSGDNNTLLVLSASTSKNITYDSGLTENFEVEFINIGTANWLHTEGTGSLNNPDGTIMLPNKVAMMVHIGNTGEYWLKGELE